MKEEKTGPELQMVILAVEDLQKVAAFYESAFGWPRRIDEKMLVEFELPGGRGLALYHNKGFAHNTGRMPPRFEGYGTTGTELYFRCAALDERIDRIKSAGGRVLAEKAPRPWGDMAAYFADPEGNVLAVGRKLKPGEEEGGDAIVLTRENMVYAGIEEVFAAWTTEEGVKTFFAPQAHVDARVGGTYEMYFMPDAPEGSRGSEGCTVIEFEPNRHLAFTWNFPPTLPAIRNEHTRIDIWFTRIDDEITQLTMKQSGWKHGHDWLKGLQYFEQAWDIVLERLNKRFRFGPVEW